MLDVAAIAILMIIQAIRMLIGAFVLWLLYRLIRSFIAYMRGDRERAKGVRGQLIGFVIAFILLWPLTGIRLQQSYLEWRYRPRLYEVAAALGYTDEDLLIEDFTCGDFLLTIYPLAAASCSSVLHFTTDMTVADLEPLVTQFPTDRIRVEERHDSVAGTVVLLNATTRPSPFAIAGNQDASQVASERVIHNYEWSFYQSDNNFQTVWLYETAAVVGLEFDGNPIKKNIILVDIGVGRVFPY
jgi:hypothetical protein